jgi:hypothetical protein
MNDLAPDIYRQRLSTEDYPTAAVTDGAIRRDLYTRRAYEPNEAVRFTQKYFSTSEIRCKDV